jgi:hypothetical protein
MSILRFAKYKNTLVYVAMLFIPRSFGRHGQHQVVVLPLQAAHLGKRTNAWFPRARVPSSIAT